MDHCECSKSLMVVESYHLDETLIRLDGVAVEDYYYTTIIDENVNWMQYTYLVSIFSLNIKALFCTFAFTSENRIVLLIEHMRKKMPLPYAYYVHLCLKLYPSLHSHYFVHGMKSPPLEITH